MKLKNVFNVSLCKNGVLGGLLYVNQTELTYCTNKVTVPAEIRRLHMPYNKISSIEKASFHTIIVTLKSGESYRFLIFSRNKFLNRVNDFTKR